MSFKRRPGIKDIVKPEIIVRTCPHCSEEVARMLAMVDLHSGEALFGAIGMVFGGMMGLSGALSFIRSMWMPGIFPIDGWWFLRQGLSFPYFSHL